MQYQGETHSCVDGTEHVVRGVSSGVHRIKELTDNTCEWTRVQRVDLKVKGMPKAVVQVITKNQLGFANEIQELYRRNGKEVDREKMDALTQIMRERRGEKLTDDQQVVIERCMALLGDVNDSDDGNAWKVIGRTNNRHVTMKMRYSAPKPGERQIATAKAVGVADCSPEEAAAWWMDYCSNETMRIHREKGNPARILLRGKVRRIRDAV